MYLHKHTHPHSLRTHTHHTFSKDTAGLCVCVCLHDREREICPPTHPSVTEWCRTKCPPPYNTVKHHSHCPAQLPPPLRGQILPLSLLLCSTHTPVPLLTSIHLLSAVSPSGLSVSSSAALAFFCPVPCFSSSSLIWSFWFILHTVICSFRYKWYV